MNKKKLFIKLLIFLNLIIFSYNIIGKEILYYQLEKRNGLYYEKSLNKLFTGKVIGLNTGEIVEGKKEGRHLKFYKNGKMLSDSYYKHNELDGISLQYFRNGNLLSEKNYKNGILKIKLPKRKESISKPNRVINIG